MATLLGPRGPELLGRGQDRVWLVGDTTGPVRAPLLPLCDAATVELAALLEHVTLAEAARWR